MAWRAHSNHSFRPNTSLLPTNRSPLDHLPIRTARISTMSDEKRVVYLEDLESPSASQTTDTGKENTTVKETTKAVAVAEKKKDASGKAAATKTGTKRQATLMDMFSSGGSAGTAQPSAKKVKLDKSGSAAAVSVAQGSSGVRAGQTLNSIPFSPSEFVASLSEDERRLLALECESMGKSWCVRWDDRALFGCVP